ncbi:MAG: qcrB [Planctomycetaceae bacterium]|nr:qcrB [Planctomycetaceae bacterium]
MHSALNWLEERTGFRELMHEALYERIPGGARWRYVWGSTLVFTFTIQMMTGFFLWMAYAPSTQTAWESVYYIEHVMQYGWLVRGLHHFTAQAMIVLMALHLMQVIIDGAYKAPREVNFWLGLILMLIVLGLSLTGYLLPWDQKGYWATQVATNIAGGTPVVGAEVQKLAAGGPAYGHHTLTRFFALHAGLLPLLLIAFLALHIWCFRRHGITVPNPNRAPEAFFWPDQVLKDAVACLAILAAVLAMVFWQGAELGAPANPSENYSAARPEWYFLFLFEMLKYFPGKYEVVGAMVIPGLVMGVLFLMPLTAKIRGGHRLNIGFISVLLAACLTLTIIAIRKDRNNTGYKAAVEQAHKDATRVVELAQSPNGIGPTGALALLKADAYTQGPRLFAKNCATCHRHNGKDGMGKDILQTVNGVEQAVDGTASDLGNFGTREWIKAVITDFPKLFGPTEKAGFQGKLLGKHFTEGSMAEWSKTHGVKLKVEDLNAITEFLVAQSGRELTPPLDPKLVEKGKEFFQDGNDEISESCAQCHAMHAKGDAQTLDGGGNGPDLTGYGSAKWLTSFVNSPGAKEHYGKRNRMPAFEKRMNAEELRLLVDWMQGNWYKPKAAPAPQGAGIPQEVPAPKAGH